METDSDINKTSGTLTEVRIRVGTLGDESLSREILEKVKKHISYGMEQVLGTKTYFLK